ncbi:hypothetical protein NQ317_003987, partial [Molorchus minor]
FLHTSIVHSLYNLSVFCDHVLTLNAFSSSIRHFRSGAVYKMPKNLPKMPCKFNLMKNQKLIVLQLSGRKNEDFNQKNHVLTIEQVDHFLRKAPDNKYLVICSYCGRYGSLLRKELLDLESNDVRDMDDFFLFTVRYTKNKVDRNFKIVSTLSRYSESMCHYEKLRPLIQNFLLNTLTENVLDIQWGKICLVYFHGKLAAFLKLENETSYTGHCFRRTSTSLLADSGAKIDVLKRHERWKSSNVVEGYVESSIKNKQNISDKIFGQVTDLSSMDMRSSSLLSPPVSAALSEQTSVQYENGVSGMNQLSLSAALTQPKLVNIANCNNVNVRIVKVKLKHSDDLKYWKSCFTSGYIGNRTQIPLF